MIDKILKNPKISKSIKQKALIRKILKLRMKHTLQKLLKSNDYDFVTIKEIDVDLFHMNDFWNNQYNEIKETYK